MIKNRAWRRAKRRIVTYLRQNRAINALGDGMLMGIALAFLMASMTVLLFFKPEAPVSLAVGEVKELSGKAKRMAASDHAWVELKTGGHVYEGDTLQTEDGSVLRVKFGRGRSLDLLTAATVQLEGESDALTAAVLDGDVEVVGIALRHEIAYKIAPTANSAGVLAFPQVIPLPQKGPDK